MSLQWSLQKLEPESFVYHKPRSRCTEKQYFVLCTRPKRRIQKQADLDNHILQVSITNRGNEGTAWPRSPMVPATHMEWHWPISTCSKMKHLESLKNAALEPGMVRHACNPRAREAGEISVGLRPAWSTWGDPGQPKTTWWDKAT